MTLDVLISTLGIDGINRVANMNLPIVKNVNYIVSWQLPDINEQSSSIPHQLIRNDIHIFKIFSRGISINRNNAIKQSSADICLIADDDLIYTTQQLQSVIKAFVENPDYELIAFKYSGDDNKNYPIAPFDLTEKQKGYYISEIEIAFRREVGNVVLFNEFFGPGLHPLQACEGAIFIHQALSKGIKSLFIPITITHHAGGISTGNRALSPGVLMAQGAYISIVYPSTALLRLPLFAWRSSRRGQTKMFPAMRHLWRGYIYGKRYFNHDGSLKKTPPEP